MMREKISGLDGSAAVPSEVVWLRGTDGVWKQSRSSMPNVLEADPADILWGIPQTQEAVDALNARESLHPLLYRFSTERWGEISRCPFLLARMGPVEDLEVAVASVQEEVYIPPEDAQAMVDPELGWNVCKTKPGAVALSPRLIMRPGCLNGIRLEISDDARKMWDCQQKRKQTAARREETRLAAWKEATRRQTLWIAETEALWPHLHRLQSIFPEGMTLPPVERRSQGWGNPTTSVWAAWIWTTSYALSWGFALRMKKPVLQALVPFEEAFLVATCANERMNDLLRAMRRYAFYRGRRVGQLFSASLLDTAEKVEAFSTEHVTEADRRRLARQRKEVSI